MAMIPPDPQSAADYDDRTTVAVKTVLIELGQILGSFQGKFSVIGGAVPWLLLDNEEMPHVGTSDVDLGLDAEALGDGFGAQNDVGLGRLVRHRLTLPSCERHFLSPTVFEPARVRPSPAAPDRLALSRQRPSLAPRICAFLFADIIGGPRIICQRT